MDMKKHGYWVAMGVLALIAFVLYFVLVMFGIDAELDTKTKQLQTTVKKLQAYASIQNVTDPADGFPTTEVVEYWTNLHALIAADAKAIEDRYRARAKKFQHIMGADANGQVDLAHFVQEISDRVRQDLKEGYKTLFEDNFEKAVAVDQPRPQSDDEISFVQKKFYIAKDALKAIGAAVSDPSRKSWRGQVVEIKATEPTKPEGKAAPKDVSEIPVEITVRIPAPCVGRLVSNLLRSDTTLFELHEVQVEPAPFSYPELEPYKLFDMAQTPGGQPAAGAAWLSFPKNVYIGTIDATIVGAKPPLPELNEPLVKVRVSLSALDFNFPEKPKAPQ